MTRAELLASVEAAYGVASAAKVASDYSLSRNAVIGIWHRARKAHRIGLVVRATRARPAPEAEPEAVAGGEVVAAVDAAPAPVAPVEPASAPLPTPRLIPAPLPRVPRSTVLLDLTGAALAYTKADSDGARTCRWPIGDPREPEFRFCGEVVTTPTIPGVDGHDRPNAYCDKCRARSLGQRTEKFRPAVLGHAAFATPRQVKKGALRFGRASA